MRVGLWLPDEGRGGWMGVFLLLCHSYLMVCFPLQLRFSTPKTLARCSSEDSFIIRRDQRLKVCCLVSH
jgi:hypothetical protein